MPSHQPPDPLTDGTFPDFPPRGDLQNTLYLFVPGYLATLNRHFGNQDRNFVLSAVPIAWNPLELQGMHIPDLIIAFNVDQAAIIEQWGYSIEDRGKPPDFVLETASAISPIWPELSEMPELPDLRKRPEIQARHTPNDYAERRNDYAAFGIPEYWRFDPTGGQYYETGLAGDRLVDGVYQPITIVHTDATHHWGHSEVLNLDLCWEDGELRWWDPVEKHYLSTQDEMNADKITAQARADTARAERDSARARADTVQAERDTARAQADTAEARIQELEEELRRSREQ